MDKKETRKDRYASRVDFGVASATNQAKEVLIKTNFPSKIQESPSVPVLFTVDKPGAFDTGPIKSVRTEHEPITIDLIGGEKIEIGKYSEKSPFADKDSYGLAIRIYGRDPHYPHSDKPVQHPWVMLKTELMKDKTSVIPLEKVALQLGEEEEILRYLAVFKSKDIDVTNIKFNLENYPKIALLEIFGRSIAEESPTSIDWQDFTDTLHNSATTQEELNDKRDIFMSKINSPDDLSTLYDEDYLNTTFGENYKVWLENVYAYLNAFGSTATPFSFKAFINTMSNPETEETVSADEEQTIFDFIVKNRLAIQIGDSTRGKEMVTNPRVVAMVGRFPNEA